MKTGSLTLIVLSLHVSCCCLIIFVISCFAILTCSSISTLSGISFTLTWQIVCILVVVSGTSATSFETLGSFQMCLGKKRSIRIYHVSVRSFGIIVA